MSYHQLKAQLDDRVVYWRTEDAAGNGPGANMNPGRSP